MIFLWMFLDIGFAQDSLEKFDSKQCQVVFILDEFQDIDSIEYRCSKGGDNGQNN